MTVTTRSTCASTGRQGVACAECKPRHYPGDDGECVECEGTHVAAAGGLLAGGFLAVGLVHWFVLWRARSRQLWHDSFKSLRTYAATIRSTMTTTVLRFRLSLLTPALRR